MLRTRYIGVTATVYAHVRLRLQHQALDTLGRILDAAPMTEDRNPDDGTPADHDEDPPTSGILVR